MNSSVHCRKVLGIYTGGTIGMFRNEDNVLAPRSNAFAPGIRKNPAMHDASWPTDCEKDAALMLPYVEDQRCRVSYKILEYAPLLDSSNMGVSDWVRIVEDIRRFYNDYDGFVILHGTDTLSYTASALSFMLENLDKTVIVTGSQIPIFDTRSDGRDNLISSLILAGNYVIPEVCVFFDRKLFRGNRTIKVNCDSFGAFGSPNAGPLATMGVKIKVDPLSIRMPTVGLCFTVHTKMDPKVGLLRLYPTITGPVIQAVLVNVNGLVLMTYGAGNIPSNQADMIVALSEASKRGVLMINVTQCTGGTVAAIYETSQPLQECGVVPGLDMTPEAALAKLSYVLGRDDWDLEMKKTMLRENLRGEFTDPEGNADEELLLFNNNYIN